MIYYVHAGSALCQVPTFKPSSTTFNPLVTLPSLHPPPTMNATNVPAQSGIICTPDQYNTSLSDPLIHCLTRGDTIGLTLAAQAGLLSLLTVLYVFFIIIRNAIYRLRRRRGAPMRMRYIFRKPTDILMLSLFFSDLLQAIGTVMYLKWVGSGHVEVGKFCSAQGGFLFASPPG